MTNAPNDTLSCLGILLGLIAIPLVLAAYGSLVYGSWVCGFAKCVVVVN